MNVILILLTLICLPIQFVEGQSWPAWRGADNNGLASGDLPPLNWSNEDNIRWRFALPGPSPSTPILVNNRLFMTTTVGDSLLLMALSTDGQLLWKKSVAGENRTYRQGESNDAAPSPSSDGKNVWALFGSGDLICVDLDGNLVWQTNIQKRYGKFSTYFGMAMSPLLWEDRLFLSLIHDNAQLVVALDKSSGKELWKKERTTNARNECLHSYTSPILYHFGGEPQLITHGADHVISYNVLTGAEIWRSGGLQNPNNYNDVFRFVASPVAAPGLLVVPSAKNGPVLGINPSDASGDITGKKPHLRWKMTKGTTDVPSPLIHDGLVYVCRENGVVICLNAETGEQVYEKRVYGGRHRSSPIIHGDRLYLPAMDGVVNVIKTGPNFAHLATNKMEERIFASPLIVDGVLYIRTEKALYAISGDATGE